LADSKLLGARQSSGEVKKVRNRCREWPTRSVGHPEVADVPSKPRVFPLLHALPRRIA
jgi:hypothetical protein